MNNEQVRHILSALKKLSKSSSGLHINELRVVLALERLVARLSGHDELARHLVFKGGFVLLKQYASDRFTRDADALAVNLSKTRLKDLATQAIMTDLDDGLWYGDVQVKELEEQGQYGAYRFVCAFQIGLPEKHKIHKLPRVHIDIGFSDSLLVEPSAQEMQSVLDDIKPVSWRVYPVEQIVAEKLETIFQRGPVNSRAKDVYDLVYLFPRCSDKNALLASIHNTFNNRETQIPRSFFEGAHNIEDLTFLESAWQGVKVLHDKPSFEDL